MSSSRLTLSLLLGALLLSPAASAQQFGMDDQYQQFMQFQAANSTANTGEGPHNNGPTTLDNQYLQNHDAPWGNVSAPLTRTDSGLFSTFKGNFGQFINKPNLPVVETGLNAVMGGYTRNAARKHSSGGFSGKGGGSLLYPLLPPTSTTPVDLHTAF